MNMFSPENEKFTQRGHSPEHYDFRAIETQFAEFPVTVILLNAILTICKDAIVGVEEKDQGWLLRIPLELLKAQLHGSAKKHEVALAFVELKRFQCLGLISIDYQHQVRLDNGRLIDVFYNAKKQYGLKATINALPYEKVEPITSLDELGFPEQ